MAQVEPVSQALAASKFAPIASYVRDEQYTLRDLGALRARSIVWTMGAAITSIAGLAAAAFVWMTRDPSLPEDALIGAGFFVFVSLVFYLIILRGFVGLRGVSGHFPELAAFDNRPPILYLRNFANENPDLQAETGGLPLAAKASFEHYIGTFFWNLGRVVALGDPLQRRPSGSVSRLFVTDAGWRQTVENVMAQSQAIIIHYAAGANVDWEVDQSERFPETPRLVILNLVKAAGQRSVSDLPAPAALAEAFAKSRRRLPAGPALMIAAIRDRKGETLLATDPTAQSLGRILNRFRRAFKTRVQREDLPAPARRRRDTLHFWTYLPSLVALVGPVALLLVAVALWFSQGAA